MPNTVNDLIEWIIVDNNISVGELVGKCHRTSGIILSQRSRMKAGISTRKFIIYQNIP